MAYDLGILVVELLFETRYKVSTGLATPGLGFGSRVEELGWGPTVPPRKRWMPGGQTGFGTGMPGSGSEPGSTGNLPGLGFVVSGFGGLAGFGGLGFR